MKFQELNIITPILKALSEEGYTDATPIQEKAIPVVLQRDDLLGCAQTGTGKTAAFAIPLLQLIYNKKPAHHIQCLILTPTRELAIQIGDSFAAYGRHLPIKHLVIYGGVSQHPQTKSLDNGIEILIATPGRLLDLMQQGHISLKHIEYFVLDEADRMLDMGFINDVRRVVGKLPNKRQTLFFSATMPMEIADLAKNILQNPKYVEVTPVSSTVQAIDQQLYYVDKEEKRNFLTSLLNEAHIQSAIIFTRTKHGADRVSKHLNKAGIKSEAIHGDKSQNQRQNALNKFKGGEARVLVATDIAARGIDIENLSHVINFDLPNVPETYVHRIGRTGRAGATGSAISFCDYEELGCLKDIEKLIGKKIKFMNSANSLTPKDKKAEPKENAKKDYRHKKKNNYSKR
jgi:ATP-dependent RNA helicase RhlE